MRPDIFNIDRAMKAAAFELGILLQDDELSEFTDRVLAFYTHYQESLPPYIIHRLKPLGPRYEAITRLIFESIRDYGRAPSIQEMVDGTNITSTSVVNYYLDRLVVFKIIERDKGVKRISRALRIAEC